MDGKHYARLLIGNQDDYGSHPLISKQVNEHGDNAFLIACKQYSFKTIHYFLNDFSHEVGRLTNEDLKKGIDNLKKGLDEIKSENKKLLEDVEMLISKIKSNIFNVELNYYNFSEE